MKKLIFVMTVLITMASCASSKVGDQSNKGLSEEKKIIKQADIKQAVEMRKFLIKFDRLYSSGGGRADLVPKSNYIIIDGPKVVISAAYIGRQYGTRPIKGIDMIGTAVSFEMKPNESKGSWAIKMKVKNDLNTFDVYVNITKDGYCDASITSYKIDHIRYTGNFIPLRPAAPNLQPEEQSDSTRTVI